MEQADFVYLSTTGEQIRKEMATARLQLAAGRQPEALANIDHAENLLRVLLYYEVPVTEARQIVYHAGRLHATDQRGEASARLNLAEQALNKIAHHGDAIVQRTLQDSFLKIKELQVLIGEAAAQTSPDEQARMSADIGTRFIELGHKLNMMALKGDMALAGSHFHD